MRCLTHTAVLASLCCLHLSASGCGKALEAEVTQNDTASVAQAALTSGPVMLKSVNSGKVIDIWNGVNANGARIQQWDAWGGPMQQWTLQTQSDGSVAFFNALTSKVLDVGQGSQTNGATVWLWTPTGGTNQHWRATKLADGNYTFTNVNSGKCMDLLGLRTDDGAPLGQWDCNGKANQEWALVPVAGSTTPSVPTAPASQSTGRLGYGADPAITYFNGMYYLVQGDWGQHVTVYRSTSLNTLMTSQSYVYTDTVDSGFNAEAPDIAVVTDPRNGQQKLAIYITKAMPYPGTIKVLLTADPSQGFEDMGILANVSGYDAHLLSHPNGKLYVLYSNFQSLEIIQMANPWTTTGSPVTISTAYLSWETQSSQLNEAPATVVSGNTLNLVYSANTYNQTNYLCGLITIPTSADPMNASNWTKHTGGAVFTSANGHYGPGSGTFFNDGTSTWWAYGSFADPSNVNREIRAQTVTFDSNGNVQLGSPL